MLQKVCTEVQPVLFLFIHKKSWTEFCGDMLHAQTSVEIIKYNPVDTPIFPQFLLQLTF
jgi:hypothetical protein